MEFPRRKLPPLARVAQTLSHERIDDVARHLRQRLDAEEIRKKIGRGARIAITAGSRGFGGFLESIRTLAEYVREAGGIPIVVPSMGSHGGATADGQKDLLRALGVSEDTVPAEIVSSMDTVCLGRSQSGAKAHFDSVALECDGIIVLGRVKTHPENTEGIASGLLKMVAVGLGKQAGAQEAHSQGLWESVREVPRLAFEHAKILCGVAVVENAFREPVAIEVVPGKYDAFRRADENLLGLSRQLFARIPFTALDLLIVDEMGKNISGTGMDLNVVGPWRVKGGERLPDYKRIAVLSLTPESRGNGLGIGLADFTTRRFQESFDPRPTYVNLLTATEPGVRNTVEAVMPPVMPSDREALEAALYSTLADKPRVCRIKNTAELAEFWVSESLFGEVESGENLKLIGVATELRFDPAGNLL